MRRPHSRKERPVTDALRRAGVLVLLAAALHGAPAGAQRFGQWWWDGSVGLGQRSYDNRVDSTETSSYDQRNLELSLGLHGYVIHPALARFDVKTDLSIAEIDGGRGLDSQRIGLGADLELTPRGTYPTRLSFQRERFDYSNLNEEDPFSLAAIPDTATTWSLRNRIRRGPARGLLSGWETSTIDFVDPDASDDRRDRQFVDWNRRFGEFQHHLRIEHRLRDYGAVDLEIEDTTLTFDERANLGEAWRWTLSALGIQRTITVPDAASGFGVDDYRVRNQLTRPVRETDRIDFQYQVAAVRPELGDDSLGHDLRLFYRWRPRETLELAPFVQYYRQEFDSRTVTAPRTGLAATWRGSLLRVDMVTTAQVSAGRTSTDFQGAGTIDQDEIGLSTSVTLSHGEAARLRQELELEVTRDDLSIGDAPLLDVPEFGLPIAGGLVQSSRRARFTLEHRHGTFSVGGWTEWQLREITGDDLDRNFESENLSVTLQASGRTWSILANTGQLMNRRDETGDQTVDFAGGSISWRPWRFLEIYGSYRSDTRELTLAPDVDGDRWQAGTRFHLGQLSFEGLVFNTTENLMGGPERVNSGFRFTITRRFAGWLPIVTAPERRGVIR